MPRIDDMIDALGKAKYITILDLTQGYWQVPMQDKSRPRTAFTTPFKLFQFRVMPFGLHGAPATFQHMMDQLLAECTDYAAAYLDDVVIHSTCWKEHIDHIRSVLQRLRGQSSRWSQENASLLWVRNCAYLGHVVGNGEVCPEKLKITAVEEFHIPCSNSFLSPGTRWVLPEIHTWLYWCSSTHRLNKEECSKQSTVEQRV